MRRSAFARFRRIVGRGRVAGGVVVVCAGLVLSGCGDASDEGPPEGAPITEIIQKPGDVPQTPLVEARYLGDGGGGSAPSSYGTIVTSRAEADRFGVWTTGEPGAFADVDFAREAVVAIGPVPTTCSPPRDFGLAVAGHDLRLTYRYDTPVPEECVQRFPASGTFAVPKDRIPAQPTVMGAPASPAAPGELLVFERLDASKRPGVPGDPRVTASAALDAFTAVLPAADAKAVRDALAARPPGPAETRIAFVVSGCRETTAGLTRENGTVSAVAYAEPPANQHVTCVVAEHYAAVFAVSGAEWNQPGAYGTGG